MLTNWWHIKILKITNKFLEVQKNTVTDTYTPCQILLMLTFFHFNTELSSVPSLLILRITAEDLSLLKVE